MALNFVAKLAIQVAMTAASMALTMSRKIEGPRLDSTKFTGGDYGAALKLTWGKRRHECPIFWAEDLREVKQQRKTKGGKYNDYTYFGTWAVALAGHEVSGITRIWLDTHLAYDATGAGPVTPFDFGATSRSSKGSGSSAGVGGVSINDHMAVYYGTETQEPDPRMLATVEAEFGEGSCPAYRGTAYIIFKDLPLEKVGNRIPQVSVEVVSSAASAYPYETFDILDSNLARMWGAAFSPDYSRFMWANNVNYEIWDVAARARMISGTLPVDTDLQSTIGIFNDGTFLTTASGQEEIRQFTADGLSYTLLHTCSGDHASGGVRVVEDGNGTEHWCSLSYSFLTGFVFDGVEYDTVDLTGIAWKVTTCFVDSEGSVWVGGGEVAAGDTAYFLRMVTGEDATGPSLVSVSGLTASGGSAPLTAIEGSGNFVFQWDTDLYAADKDTGAIVASNTTISFDPYNIDTQFNFMPPGASTIWIDNKEVSLADLTIVRTVTFTDWTAEAADGVVYDPLNHALITSPTALANITWRYLDRIDGDGVALSVIHDDISDMVGVTDYNHSAVSGIIIDGWSGTQGQASNILEPLDDAHDVEVRLHDFTLQAIPRTGVSGGTILTERFVANDPRYSVKVRQAAELPRAIIVTFADTNADQQPNTARADRPLDATGAKGEQSIDMGTWATDPDTARQMTDRFFRRMWNERKEVSTSLTAQHLSLEPGDCRTLDLDGESDIYRLVRLTVKANGELATEWKYDHPSLAVIDSTTGAVFDGRNPSEIVVPLISKGFVLDIPLLSDGDTEASPVVYLAAAPYASGTWPGAVVYQAVDGEYSEEIGSIASSAPATWGYANEVLPDANPWLWDRGSSVNVTIQTGALTGCTEAQIDATPTLNLALIGDELVNFTTATLEGDGTYTLSGFKRGRRGTEWACGTHADRDVFLLLSTADSEALGLSEVGTNLSFKAVTSGRTESGSFPIALAPFTGASLKPYAPCHLEAVKESNDDWTLTWVRRTRVGGAWTSGTSIPLSEASEEYEVDILDAPGGTVVRTISALSSATATYTAAQQVTDGGDVTPGNLYFEVYQISDAVDRGFAAEAAA